MSVTTPTNFTDKYPRSDVSCSAAEKRLKKLHWKRGDLAKEMEGVCLAMSQTNLSTFQLEAFLRAESEATEIIDKPPRYVQDLLEYMNRQDREGWVEVKGKGGRENSKDHNPRSFLSMWIGGEDLKVFAAMQSEQGLSEDSSIQVSVDSNALFSDEYQPKAKPHPILKTRSDRPEPGQQIESLRRFVNSFAFLGSSALNLTACDAFSDSDESEEDEEDALSLGSIDVSHDVPDAVLLEGELDSADMAFCDRRIFGSIYECEIPAVKTDVRSLRTLIDTRDWWSTNRHERRKLHGHWQQTAMDIQATKSTVRFSQLREEHASLLAEIEDCQDQVRAPTPSHDVMIW